MKMVDKIDIDKDNEHLDQLRKNNSPVGNDIPKKDKEMGFCTKCLIY